MGLVDGETIVFLKEIKQCTFDDLHIQNLVAGTLRIDFVAKMASSHDEIDIPQRLVSGISLLVCADLYISSFLDL